MKHKFGIIFPVILVVIMGLPIVASLVYSRTAKTDRQKAGQVSVSENEAWEQDSVGVSEEPEAFEEAVEPSEENVSADGEMNADLMSKEASYSSGEIPEEPEEEPEKIPLPKYNDLLEVNPYLAGWLSISGSPIDGPVVYTPGSQNYFLHRDLEGRDSERGTFFIAINWREANNHTLIYGHNMKDGSGFGSLQKFADSSFGLKHKDLHFDTLYEDKDYELLGVFYSQIQEDELETEDEREQADQRIAQQSIEKIEKEKEKEIEESGQDPSQVEIEPVTEADLKVSDLDLYLDWGDSDIYREEKDEDNGRFRYYYYIDLSDEDEFNYYVDSVRERALYDTGTEVKWGDELLTLSTCSYQVKNGRFVVVAVHHRS